MEETTTINNDNYQERIDWRGECKDFEKYGRMASICCNSLAVAYMDDMAADVARWAERLLRNNSDEVAAHMEGLLYIDDLEHRKPVVDLNSSPDCSTTLRTKTSKVIKATDTERVVTTDSCMQMCRWWEARLAEITAHCAEGFKRKIAATMERQGATRREVLEFMMEEVNDCLDANRFGKLFLENKNNLRSLVKSIHSLSGGHQGEALDELISLVAQREWLEGEMNAELSGGARVEPNSFGSTEPKEGLVPGTKCEMRNAECQDGGASKDNSTAIVKGSMAVKVTRSEWFCALSDKERYEALAVLFVMMVQRGLINRSTRGMSVAAFCSFLVKEVGLADVQERSINRMLTPFRESINKGDGMRFLSEHVSKMKEIERLLK